MRSALTVLGDYTVVEAADGLQAQLIISETNPDLNVLDLPMPNMGGIDLLIARQEKLKRWRSRVWLRLPKLGNRVASTTAPTAAGLR